jgi:hypothetical protein
MFFPSHKDKIFIVKVIDKSVFLHMLLKGAKSLEPNLQIIPAEQQKSLGDISK